MKNYILKPAVISLLLIISLGLHAQNFDQYFSDSTLRLDYIFTGNIQNQSIALDGLSKTNLWAGRRHHLSELPLKGNGQITMKDIKSGNIIYETSFSALFLEWLGTDEAKSITRAFQNTFLVPYPKEDAEIDIKLFDTKQQVAAELKHIVKPNDMLIHDKSKTGSSQYEYLLKSGSYKDCIDIAIMGEGYTVQETDSLRKDAKTAIEALFSYEPFKKYKKKFNIILAITPSKDSGVSTPRLHDWKETPFGSHFDTFYSDRYLTTNQTEKIHDALSQVPYEHIIILANSTVYGGGGIYNAFTLTAAHHKFFRPIVVHEFGHSFGGLADEYFYDNDAMTDTYDLKTEPWEPNVTTLVDFDSKWKDMLPKDTPIPTPLSEQKDYPVGVYEGAAYSKKGIYRGSVDCRMKTNTAEEFCPVCQRALERLILFYTDKNK